MFVLFTNKLIVYKHYQLCLSCFPRQLKQAMSYMKGSNVVSGFKKCGIYPFSREALLSQLPHQVDHNTSAQLKERVAVTLIDFLKERRFGAPEVGESSIPANNRGKKLEIPAGKSASEEDLKVMLEVAEAKAAKPVRRKRAAPETWSTSKSDGIKLKIKKNK